jgi:hypothetical protein
MVNEVDKIRDFVSVDEMLKEAAGNFKSAIIIGYDNDGYLSVNTTGNIKCRDILWMIEEYKIRLLSCEFSQ